MKKVTVLILIVFCICLLQPLNAQIKVDQNNNVGIGVEAPVSKLSVGNVGNTHSKVYFENTTTSGTPRALQLLQVAPVWTSGNDYGYGGYSSIGVTTAGYKHIGFMGVAYSSTALNNARSYGLFGQAGNAYSGCNYAVYANLAGSNNGVALFASTPTYSGDVIVSDKYAAYLRGKVFIEDKLGVKNTNPSYELDVTGSINASGYVYCKGVPLTSDISLKTDLRELEGNNLSKISLLKAMKYKYILPESLKESMSDIRSSDTLTLTEKVELPNPEMYNQDQIGLIAQDLQKVFPELVIADAEGKLAINYTGLIPVLIEGMKEQQAEIEILKAELKKLSEVLQAVKPKEE